jgi:hypothetical protein
MQVLGVGEGLKCLFYLSNWADYCPSFSFWSFAFLLRVRAAGWIVFFLSGICARTAPAMTAIGMPEIGMPAA